MSYEVFEKEVERSTEMYRSYGTHPLYYVRFENGRLFLNSENSFISTFFRGNAYHVRWKESLWLEFNEIATKYEKTAGRFFRPQASDYGSEYFTEGWGDEEPNTLAEVYLLNLFIHQRVMAKDIQRQLKKIQESNEQEWRPPKIINSLPADLPARFAGSEAIIAEKIRQRCDSATAERHT